MAGRAPTVQPAKPQFHRPCLTLISARTALRSHDAASANSAPRRPNDVDAVDADAGTRLLGGTLRTGSMTQAQATRRRLDDCARLLPSGFSPTYSRACGSTGRQVEDRRCSCTRSSPPSVRPPGRTIIGSSDPMRLACRQAVEPSGSTIIGPLGPITQTCWLPLGVGTSQRRRRRRIAVPMPPRVFELVGLALDLRRCYAGSGHLSRRVGCVDLREPDAGLGRSVPDEGMLTWPCARQCGRNHGRVRAGGTAPSRRSVGFAGLGRRLICWTVTQVLDVCLTGLVGDLRGWNAGLSEFETRF